MLTCTAVKSVTVWHFPKLSYSSLSCSVLFQVTFFHLPSLPFFLHVLQSFCAVVKFDHWANRFSCSVFIFTRWPIFLCPYCSRAAFFSFITVGLTSCCSRRLTAGAIFNTIWSSSPVYVIVMSVTLSWSPVSSPMSWTSVSPSPSLIPVIFSHSSVPSPIFPYILTKLLTQKSCYSIPTPYFSSYLSLPATPLPSAASSSLSYRNPASFLYSSKFPKSDYRLTPLTLGFYFHKCLLIICVWSWIML